MNPAASPAGDARPDLPAAGSRILDPHRHEMADMLAEISIEIEHLGEALCHDPEFVRRHVHELQAIDLIAQKQRALADLLRAECPISALDAVGLDEVVGRFRALGGKPD